MAASFEVLPGLPGDGPYPEQFTTAGGTHREGFVVRVLPERGPPWVGNFQRGLGTFSGVMWHPGGRLLLVIAHGQAYLVDPESRRLASTPFDGISGVLEASGWVILASFTDLMILSPHGGQWVSPRVAWDGIRNVRIEGGRLLGDGWSAVLDAWRP